MNLSRRDFIRLSGLVAAGAAASGACAPAYGLLSGAYAEHGPWPRFDVRSYRALSRLTFGPTVRELNQAGELGIAGWLEEQLDPEAIDDQPGEWLIRRYEIVGMDASDLDLYERDDVLKQMRSATLQRQLYSRRQLFERIVEFWTDHFNIYVEKGECWSLKVVDDREVVRRHALGAFNDLLSASAHSPAMLVYLDNQVNESSAPNENYAREVMELHTLGVDGGYSQRDVMELARCLTGWTVKDHFWKGEFHFEPDLHDPGSKRVLGMKIEAGGEAEAQQVLDRLSRAPATAEHLATKLVGRFISDQPLRDAPDVIDAVTRTFMETEGNLRLTCRSLFLDGLLPRLDQLPAKFKRPVDFLHSSLRGLSANSDGGTALHDRLNEMGQLPFNWPTPDGPPDDAVPWAGNLLPRWQFGLSLARGEIEGTEVDLSQWTSMLGTGPQAVLKDLSLRLLGSEPSPDLVRIGEQAWRSIDDANKAIYPQVLMAGLIASPRFQWR